MVLFILKYLLKITKAEALENVFCRSEDLGNEAE